MLLTLFYKIVQNKPSYLAHAFTNQVPEKENSLKLPYSICQIFQLSSLQKKNYNFIVIHYKVKLICAERKKALQFENKIKCVNILAFIACLEFFFPWIQLKWTNNFDIGLF